MVETAGHFPGQLMPGAVSAIESEHITHWELSDAIYHVDFRLADSVPTVQLQAWRAARAEYENRARGERRNFTPVEINEMRALYDERIERYLMNGCGACVLRRPEAAEVIRRTLEHDNGRRYSLHVWTVMPNHVHVIASVFPGEEMKRIVDVWKSVSAHGIVKTVGCTAPVWMPDHYSRIIRSSEEYARQVKYVWNNPESAGLSKGFMRKRY